MKVSRKSSGKNLQKMGLVQIYFHTQKNDIVSLLLLSKLTQMYQRLKGNNIIPNW
jgi:rRNA pseudouridine-1189 N-methylase Emg1 (Nep1/Mra1 family)